MPLLSLFADLAARLRSTEFLLHAAHPDHPTAFTRQRKVSEQAFAQARAKLSLTAIPLLNDWLIERAGHDGFVPRWNGLRLVGADGSAVRFGLRASHVKRAALADQIFFGLFLPGCCGRQSECVLIQPE